MFYYILHQHHFTFVILFKTKISNMTKKNGRLIGYPFFFFDKTNWISLKSDLNTDTLNYFKNIKYQFLKVFL